MECFVSEMVCLALQYFESLVNDGWSLHHCWQLNFIFSYNHLKRVTSEKFEIKNVKKMPDCSNTECEREK